jgi:pimeloyl-ACP methyl ester carboxylesterase
MAPESTIDKSTIVRLRPVPIPRGVRAAFRLLAALSHELAARAARWLFFRPLRTRPRREGAALLARGERFQVESAVGRVVGWAWGDGPRVLLLHGWGGHAAQLAAFVEPLVASGFRAVAIDLPGHGRSAGSRSSLRHFAAAIEAVEDAQGPFAGLVAHSFGCAGTTLAAHHGFAPRAAVFIAPPSRFGIYFDTFTDALGLTPPVAARFVELGQQFVGLRFAEVEPRRLALELQTPLLVVHDRGDDEVPFAEGQELARLWPGARFVGTEGLGHYRLLRDPEVVAATLAFVQDALAGASMERVAAG